MTKTQFIEQAADSIELAQYLAIALGVAVAQVELWTNSLQGA